MSDEVLVLSSPSAPIQMRLLDGRIYLLLPGHRIERRDDVEETVSYYPPYDEMFGLPVRVVVHGHPLRN